MTKISNFDILTETMTPKVHISVTFVSTRSGTEPPLKNHNPIDLTQDIGKFYPDEFPRLKEAIIDVVQDSSYGLFFHHETKHNYHCDEKQFPNGVIYGRIHKTEEGDNCKVTSSRLAPIQTKSEF